MNRNRAKLELNVKLEMSRAHARIGLFRLLIISYLVVAQATF